MVATSNSSRNDTPLGSVLREWLALFRMRMEGARVPNDFADLFDGISDYRRRLKELTGIELNDAKVLEIGFGQRPTRMVILQSMGVDVLGIDLDRPVIKGSIAEFLAIGRRNGTQRMAKSLARHYLFDRKERRELGNALRRRGHEYRIDPDRFFVGNVVSDEIGCRIPAGSCDFIFSIDVFEHMPQADLLGAIARIHRWLKPTGVALVQFTLFTGISGGHHTDWYPHTLKLSMPRRTEPWEHLRQRRFPANTFLNKARLGDYRRWISAEFEIIDERLEDYGLGSEFLTSDVRSELSDYSDVELLCNEVVFVLRPKHASTPSSDLNGGPGRLNASFSENPMAPMGNGS